MNKNRHKLKSYIIVHVILIRALLFYFHLSARLLNLIKNVAGIYREELRYFFKTLGKKISVFFNTESSCLKTHSKVIPDIIKRYQRYCNTIFFLPCIIRSQFILKANCSFCRAQEVGHNFVSRVRLPRYINPHFVSIVRHISSVISFISLIVSLCRVWSYSRRTKQRERTY